jgi:SAM-dependent MidA family methyltransferase
VHPDCAPATSQIAVVVRPAVPAAAVSQVGAQAMAVVEGLARRIAATGGAALLVDYGADKPYTNSLTGMCLSQLRVQSMESTVSFCG